MGDLLFVSKLFLGFFFVTDYDKKVLERKLYFAGFGEESFKSEFMSTRKNFKCIPNQKALTNWVLSKREVSKEDKKR